MSAHVILAHGVPVTPDSEEARRWAADELARDVYSTEPGLLERAWNWFVRQIERLLSFEAAAPPNLVPIIVVIAVAALLCLALYLAGPVRRRRAVAAERASHAVFDDVDATSDDLTRQADDAARRGDWDRAVLMRFRAVVRSLDERAVLDDRPGLTAHEASTAAAGRLPGCGPDLLWAGRLFDDVCYGSVRARAEQDARLRDVAGAVARARPERAVAAAGSWAALS
ncbi:DUF4129 domain-containing protein [Georgenia sunbinii]|uniref:DUF4129 domain-containing protein n=1 Tax=Georgenia sunbinii TaxID=3117728 RepID=UPI002F265F37